MARLKGNLQFTGSLGDISAYTMRGSDKVILRTKGGASKEKIKKAACFARTRELNDEWIGCTKAGKGIRLAIHPIKHMADYNISGPLNAIAKKVQTLDAVNPKGSRIISLSKYKEILVGFNLNNQNLFDGVVRTPLIHSLSRNPCVATIGLPTLIPQINFQNRYHRPLFRFVAALGIVSNMVYSGDYAVYKPLHAEVHGQYVSETTDWNSTLVTFKNQTLDLHFGENITLNESDLLILSIGVEFGNPLDGTVVEPIKYSGSAKIIAIG